MYHFASVFIRNETLVFKDMIICVSLSVTISMGCSNGLKGLVHINKAKKSFDSIFQILDIKSEIDITKEGNKNKKVQKILKVKLNLKMFHLLIQQN